MAQENDEIPDVLAPRFEQPLTGTHPATDPVTAASQYDWDATADQAEIVYRKAVQYV